MRLRTAMIATLLLATAGCEARQEAAPVLVEAAAVKPMLFWSAELNRRRVAVEGYISLDNGRDGSAIAPRPRLTTRPHGQGDALISFEIAQGTGPNELDLPVLERQSIPELPGAPDVLTVDMAAGKFQDSAGIAHAMGKKVRVIGEVRYFGVGRQPVSEEDGRSPTGRRFRPVLYDVVLEAAP